MVKHRVIPLEPGRNAAHCHHSNGSCSKKKTNKLGIITLGKKRKIGIVCRQYVIYVDIERKIMKVFCKMAD